MSSTFMVKGAGDEDGAGGGDGGGDGGGGGGGGGVGKAGCQHAPDGIDAS